MLFKLKTVTVTVCFINPMLICIINCTWTPALHHVWNTCKWLKNSSCGRESCVLHRQKICLSRRHTNRAVCILIIWENLVLSYSDFLSANIVSRIYGTVLWGGSAFRLWMWENERSHACTRFKWWV